MMMAFRAINSFKKKHTGEIQTFAPGIIPEYIKEQEKFSLDFRKTGGYETNPCRHENDSRDSRRLYLEKEIVEATQLNIIRRELDKPTHKYNSPGSLWSSISLLLSP
jgi:hypothetical protein